MSGTAYEVVTLSGTDTVDTAAATPIYFVEKNQDTSWSVIGATTELSGAAAVIADGLAGGATGPTAGDYSFTIVLPQGDAPYSIDAFNATGTFEADYTVTGGATGAVSATGVTGSTGATGSVGLSNIGETGATGAHGCDRRPPEQPDHRRGR